MNNTPLQIEHELEHELEEMHKKAISNHKKVELLKEQLEKTGAESNRQRHAKASARLNKTWKKMTTAFQDAGLPPPRAATKEGELLIDILHILAKEGFSNAVLPASLASPETSTIDKTLPGSHAWFINHSPAAREAAAARTMRRGPSGSTQLIRAVIRNNLARVSQLIQWGADVNNANYKGDTALMVACDKGYENICRLLIDVGADVNKVSHKGYTALILAVERGNENICRLLLEKGAACSKGYENICRFLLEKGADVNKVDKNGRTALIEAIDNDNINVCRLLLEKGADVNQADYYGRTALIEACRRRWTKENICRLLLEKGANVNQADENGRTALIEAIGSDNINVCRLLLENGADVNQADNYGETALGFAIGSNRVEIIRLLREWGGITHPTVTCIGCSVMGGKRKGSKMNTKRKRRSSSHRRVRKGSYRTKKSTR